MMPPGLETSQGRRYWAFLVLLGASFVFTAFAAVGVYLVSGHVLYSLILALAAHVQLFVCIGAFGWVLGRRVSVDAGRDGMKVGDSGEAVEDIKEAIQAPATAAQNVADVMKDRVDGEK